MNAINEVETIRMSVDYSKNVERGDMSKRWFTELDSENK